ncbi:MAG TPA: FGGY family carbohydrate kinase [Edaphobacter sp.]|nr:FGGY family carbohydrate kinase [Edaphobacter sp.]
MKGPVYLGIDLGTQSVRIMAVTADGSIEASASCALVSMRDGARHEQNPEDWWNAVVTCAQQVMVQLGVGREIKGLAVDATSGTILLMDQNLRPLTPGLMYDDGRAREEAIAVNEAGNHLWVGLSYRMQPSWALPKLLWLAHNNQAISHSRLAHQNDFINARLAGRALAGDSSNCLKAGFDTIRMQWPWQILDSLSLPRALFPSVVLSGTRIGEVCHASSKLTGIPAGTPIFAGMTDGCAAQLASGATSIGSWNSVIGTTIVIKGVTRDLLYDPAGVIYSHRSVNELWLPGGASSTGAGAIAAMFPPESLDALNASAQQMPPSRVIVYPLMGKGERYPFSAPGAEGFTIGQPSSIEEQYLATLQGIAFIERLAFDALRYIGAPMNGTFTISGGATKSEALNQIRASILERPLSIPCVTEGAFGMAMLAAAHGSSIIEVTERMVRIERTIEPERRFEDYAWQYTALIAELNARGWLPDYLAAFARAGAHA